MPEDEPSTPTWQPVQSLATHYLEFYGCELTEEVKALLLSYKDPELVVMVRYTNNAPAIAGIPFYLIHERLSYRTWSFCDDRLTPLRPADLDLHMDLVNIFYLVQSADIRSEDDLADFTELLTDQLLIATTEPGYN